MDSTKHFNNTILFGHLFPGRTQHDVRSMVMRRPLERGGRVILPADEYGLLERYCVDPECDCRQVLLQIVARAANANVATITHRFDPPEPDDAIPAQTFLDPIHNQTKWATPLLELFASAVLPDKAYRARLLSHYQMVRAALADPNHPCQKIVAEAQAEPAVPAPRGTLDLPFELSRGAITPPPPRRGKRKWR